MDSEKFSNACADWILDSGLPFNTVESPKFIEFCYSLNPAFKLPSRKRISAEFLNKKYVEMRKQISNIIASEGNSSFVLYQHDGA